MNQFCSFFVFFASFLPFLFLGVSGLFFGLFEGGATFDLLAGFEVSGVAPSVGRGVSGCVICTSYTVQKSGRVALSFGRGLSVPVSLSHYRGRGVSPWLQALRHRLGCNFRTSFSNKCPKTVFEQIFETSVRVAL
jgi:hypothetical protein